MCVVTKRALLGLAPQLQRQHSASSGVNPVNWRQGFGQRQAVGRYPR